MLEALADDLRLTADPVQTALSPDGKNIAYSNGRIVSNLWRVPLLRDRPILLLDEPFAALGPAQRIEMLDLVTELRAERAVTVLMVTHSPEDARRAGGDIAVVSDGQVATPSPASVTTPWSSDGLA